MNQKYSNIRQRQQGMVSIMVTMLLMVVISLIVLGFAQVSRSEVRQALDRQLSTQAFFAAESGVNDARRTVQMQLAAGNDIPEKDKCTATPDYPYATTIDSATKTSYTCLLVTSHLNNLMAAVPLDGPSIKLPLETPAAPISSLHISWQPSAAPSTADFNKCRTSLPASASNYFNSSSTWTCPIGVMRLEIVPTDNMKHDTLAAGQKVMYLYPVRGGSASSKSFGSTDGAVVRMHCPNASTACDVTLTGVNGSNFAIRVSAIYAGGNFTMDATDASGNALEFQNAQVQIDSTGRAQDVLRRIQVRLPVQGGAETPDYAIESGSSICKRFQYSQFEVVENAGDIIGQDSNNPMCN